MVDPAMLLAAKDSSPEHFPDLVQCLDSEDSPTRRFACIALIPYGPAAVVPLASLVSRTTDPETGYMAALALSKLAPEAVAALTPMLDSQEPATRQAALEGLLWIGPPAREALPAISRCCLDGDISLRLQAIAAGTRISQDYTALGHLTPFLEDPDPRIRELAVRRIGETGALASGEAWRLEALLADEDEGVRKAAGLAVARVRG